MSKELTIKKIKWKDLEDTSAIIGEIGELKIEIRRCEYRNQYNIEFSLSESYLLNSEFIGLGSFDEAKETAKEELIDFINNFIEQEGNDNE